MSTLIIAPHADDEVFGCGGTIARRASEGRAVHVVFVSSGRVLRSDQSVKVDAERRRAEFLEACRRLGVESHETWFEGAENKVDTLPRVEIVSRLDRVLESRAWEEVFIPGPSCHHDHEIVRACAIAALRQRPGRTRERTAAEYEYPQATWSAGPNDVGAWYVALGPHLETKLSALAAYASQLAPDPHPLSLAGVRRLALLRGSDVGVESAERFRIVRRFDP